MENPSESVLLDEYTPKPAYKAIFPTIPGFKLWDQNSFAKGQPFEHLAKMREQAPIMWSDAGKKYTGFWNITGYEDLRRIELQTELFSSQHGSISMVIPPRKEWKHEQLMEAAVNSLINLDPPVHTSARIQQNGFFVPKYVEQLKDKVANKIDELLDDLERKGPIVDFAQDFSAKLPLFTLCEMLGVDEADRPKIIEWMHYLELVQSYSLSPIRSFLAEPSLPFKFNTKMSEMFDYGAKVVADRRRQPRPDLLTAIANSEIDGEEFSPEFLDGSWLLIIFAGNDTTRNSLSGTMRLLTEFPEQRQLVLDDPTLIPKMNNEALRLISPVMHMRRTATADTELHGQKIASDEKVILWYGAANRDPRIFPNPNAMDILRENADRHVAFGHGPHRCLGSRIAQLQLRLAYEKILERFPKITWTGKQKIAANNFVHVISSLQVNLYG